MLVELNEQNLKSEIVEKSQTQSVVVFIYHSQSPEQTELKNKINAFIGTADLTFACADIANPALQSLAYQFQLNALPAVAVVKQSRVVAILQGDEIESGYEQVIGEYLPKEDQLLAKEAEALLAEGKTDEALTKISKSLELADQTRYRLIKADILIRQNKLDDAESIISACTMEDQLNEKEYYANLKSALELAKKALDNSPVEELKQRLAQDPDNLELKVELAVQYSQLNNKVEALNYLYEVLKKDLNFKDAKQTYLDIIATMGASAEASAFRRKLYSHLY